eukprot:gene8487-8669_t
MLKEDEKTQQTLLAKYSQHFPHIMPKGDNDNNSSRSSRSNGEGEGSISSMQHTLQQAANTLEIPPAMKDAATAVAEGIQLASLSQQQMPGTPTQAGHADDLKAAHLADAAEKPGMALLLLGQGSHFRLPAVQPEAIDMSQNMASVIAEDSVAIPQSSAEGLAIKDRLDLLNDAVVDLFQPMMTPQVADSLATSGLAKIRAGQLQTGIPAGSDGPLRGTQKLMAATQPTAQSASALQAALTAAQEEQLLQAQNASSIGLVSAAIKSDAAAEDYTADGPAQAATGPPSSTRALSAGAALLSDTGGVQAAAAEDLQSAEALSDDPKVLSYQGNNQDSSDSSDSSRNRESNIVTSNLVRSIHAVATPDLQKIAADEAAAALAQTFSGKPSKHMHKEAAAIAPKFVNTRQNHYSRKLGS